MDLNEENKSLYIPQWFEKEHFEGLLDIKLTDEQFQEIKEGLLDGAGEYLADKISDAIRNELLCLKQDRPELFIK